MNKHTDFDKFCKEFNIVDNAINMRQLTRWNGRDLVRKENLAEHTHLVVACVIELFDLFTNFYGIAMPEHVEYVTMKLAMVHDSLELLRGDILSITKDAYPHLREIIDAEETKFMKSFHWPVTVDCWYLLQLADLKACYMFLEKELSRPTNDFCKEAYIHCKEKYDEALRKFLTSKIGYEIGEDTTTSQFEKGYEEDAGVDIILTDNAVFLPLTTTTVRLNVHITPNENEMSFLCARTSAANKGLVVATCPIDPNYVGDVIAIVHNVSNNIIKYSKGESFCQYVTCKIITNKGVPIKKEGKRSTSKLGGTDKC